MSSSYSFRLYPEEFWNERKRSRSKGRVEVYFREKGIKNDEALIIFPGGGYGTISHHEGIEIARHFTSLGFCCFVVYYRVFPEKYPAPLIDGCRAIRLIKYECGVRFKNINKFIGIGFSAGGHLLGLLASCLDLPEDPITDEYAKISVKLDGIILIYPLLSLKGDTHKISLNNFTDPEDSLLRQKLSVEENLGGHVPPAFIIHACDDRVIPVESILSYLNKAAALRLRTEFHLYAGGGHGFGIGAGSAMPALTKWPSMAIDWLCTI